MKTVFITGASTGIGRETAQYFQKQGWQVIATMRNIEDGKALAALKNVKVVTCDVTDLASIKNAIMIGLSTFGAIDVLVNNSGYYLFGPVEAATHEQLKRQLDTNLLGLIEVTQAMIPHFRQRKAGVIINISSIAGIVSIPLQSLYHATKWGVEGFSESLQYELAPFNIRVKLIEPGLIKTDFYDRSLDIMEKEGLYAYDGYADKVMGNVVSGGMKGSSPEVVAKGIFKAATDGKKKMRYHMGKMSSMVTLRRFLPQRVMHALIGSTMSK